MRSVRPFYRPSIAANRQKGGPHASPHHRGPSQQTAALTGCRRSATRRGGRRARGRAAWRGPARWRSLSIVVVWWRFVVVVSQVVSISREEEEGRRPRGSRATKKTDDLGFFDAAAAAFSFSPPPEHSPRTNPLHMVLLRVPLRLLVLDCCSSSRQEGAEAICSIPLHIAPRACLSRANPLARASAILAVFCPAKGVCDRRSCWDCVFVWCSATSPSGKKVGPTCASATRLILAARWCEEGVRGSSASSEAQKKHRFNKPTPQLVSPSYQPPSSPPLDPAAPAAAAAW